MSASGAWPQASLVLVDLDTSDSLTGRSYLFAFAPWALEPIVGCLDAMSDMLKGSAVVPFGIEATLRTRLRLLDTPGLVGLALARVDMCAWDVLAQAAGLPLVRLLGGEPKPVRADYVMPDVQRIGGVTGWLRAAAITQAHGMEMSSHLFPEYSAHLLAVTPTAHWLEYMDWANPLVNEPIEIENGHAIVPDRPGSGITWNEDAVKRYRGA